MDPDLAIPRARAAWAFSRMDQKDLAAAASLHYDRLRAILGGGRPPKDIPIEELWAIANAAGVPRWFMEHGFDALQQTVDPALAEDLRRVEETVTQMRRALSAAGIEVPEQLPADPDASLREEDELHREVLGGENQAARREQRG